MKFVVSYPARLQVDSLDRGEKAELDRLFSSEHPASFAIKTPDSEERYVSQLGAKRVLWHMTGPDQAEILSVLDPSYAR